MQRDAMRDRLVAADGEVFDIVIVGGGATGVGAAVDAAARGYEVALFEGSDFGKGTSSRSTKLVHGGVRYLEQGNVSLVMEALHERGILRQNAPHLVSDLRFIVPTYDWWESPFYGIGLKIYDMLAGKYGFGPSKLLSSDDTLEAIPTLKTEGLRGGVQYFDGQFDDARLLINLVRTAADQGAILMNYARVVGLLKSADGLVAGVEVDDLETGARHTVRAKVVMNATGAFTDGIRRLDDPEAKPMIVPSQGVHVVLDRSFLPGDAAIMVPHTKDGRVMFAIPWHDHVVVGTTDTPIEEVSLEPRPFEEEIAFILETASAYLDHAPTLEDVLSTFAGIRPLVRAGDGKNTAALSRDHTIHIAKSGLLTIAGGKWTTYRHMAEDAVNQAATVGQLEERECPTRELRVHGHDEVREDHPLAVYGSDASAIESLATAEPGLAVPLHDKLSVSAAQVAFAVRHEMARTVDDVLARRTRALLLNARAASEAAPRVAELLAAELGRDAAWQRDQVAAFRAIASGYVL